jgi:hypothetical protein
MNLVQERAIVSEADKINQFELAEGKLLLGGKILGNFLFKECETYFTTFNLKRAAVCDPVGGEIKLLALGLLILHMGKTYVLFSPDKFETFGAINYGEECVLLKTAISGSFVLEDCSLENKLEDEPGGI